MGTGYIVVLVATVVSCDFEILTLEPILPLDIGYFAFGCIRKIAQDFLPAHACELAENRDGAVALGLLP
jgi:hypothetical protein